MLQQGRASLPHATPQLNRIIGPTTCLLLGKLTNLLGLKVVSRQWSAGSRAGEVARARKFSGRTLPGPGPTQALPWLFLLRPSGPSQSFLKGRSSSRTGHLLGGPLQKGQGKEVGSEARQPLGPLCLFLASCPQSLPCPPLFPSP